MKRARKVSNVHGKVHFKQIQTLTIVFTGNTLPNRKRSCKGAEYFIVDKIACHEHATVPKMNSHTASLNRNSLRIQAKNKNNKKNKINKTI